VIFTVAPPSDSGSGVDVAAAVTVARSLPNVAASEPGATASPR
jgi:hypothetical protein